MSVQVFVLCFNKYLTTISEIGVNSGRIFAALKAIIYYPVGGVVVNTYPLVAIYQLDIALSPFELGPDQISGCSDWLIQK